MFKIRLRMAGLPARQGLFVGKTSSPELVQHLIQLGFYQNKER
jgi:hypothetical protein